MEWSLVLKDVCGMGLSFRADGFRLLFAGITSYMWLMTSLFSKEYMAHARRKGRYYFFLALTYIATMGVFLSDDLFTTFVFFEMMSLASYVCVIHDEKPGTLRAGGVYLAVAVIGGLVSLMGLFLLYDQTGTLALDQLREACLPLLSGDAGERKRLFIAGFCILFGFGAKAGMFPLHIWLPMAHPVAPAPASALLSGIITKSGIFGMLALSADIFPHDGMWGFIICLFGVASMLLGGVLAIFSVDIKRSLACSSMSQLGMIICGIGMQGLLGDENALAVRGTVLHMVNHSNLKLALFMAAGVIVMNLHKLNLNEIRGYGRKKPLLKLCFLSGALGIVGIPLFNGYISKTLLHESIVEFLKLSHEGGWTLAFLSQNQAALLFRLIEWLFLLTGGMTVAYMTKLFICVFVEKNADPKVQEEYDSMGHYCTPLTAAVLAITAAVLPVLGMLPYATQDRLADMAQTFLHGLSPSHAVNYFSLVNLKGGFISIVLGGLIYLLIVRKLLMGRGEETEIYPNRWPEKLDLLTLIYEPLLLKIFPAVFGFCCRALDFAADGLILFFRRTTHRQLREPEELPADYVLPYYLGKGLNYASARFGCGKDGKRDYRQLLARRRSLSREAWRMFQASASFSLMMFGIGMIVSVIYLIVG